MIFFLAVFLFRVSAVRELLSPENLRRFVEGFGIAAPFMYMLVYTVLVVVFFPASVLSAVGGFIFGALWGTMYTIIAATVAAAVSFLLARWLGKDFVQKRLGGRLKEWEAKLSDGGFWTVVILRFLFLPYIPLSYAAGLTKISLWEFTLATFLTNIPGSFAFTYLGASITEPRNIAIAIVIILLVLCIPLLVKRWQKRQMSKRGD